MAAHQRDHGQQHLPTTTFNRFNRCEIDDVGTSTVDGMKKQKVQLLEYFADSDSKAAMTKRRTEKKGLCGASCDVI